MPGVFRPYTLVDVLGTMNEQITAPTGDTITGVGYFAETDEAFTLADKIATTVQATPAYDAGVWGAFTWG
jgi:hypothetical protein